MLKSKRMGEDNIYPANLRARTIIRDKEGCSIISRPIFKASKYMRQNLQGEVHQTIIFEGFSERNKMFLQILKKEDVSSDPEERRSVRP